MAFILAQQREVDCRAAFAQYRAYLAEEKHRFPKQAFTLATSDWYFSFDDHRAPHDARLESIAFTDEQPGRRKEPSPISICIKLLGAHDDALIELTYSSVVAYSLTARDLRHGHCDWRYDEFRVSDSGNLIHEIEWCGADSTANWIIEAADVRHECHPFPRHFKDGSVA